MKFAPPTKNRNKLIDKQSPFQIKKSLRSLISRLISRKIEDIPEHHRYHHHHHHHYHHHHHHHRFNPITKRDTPEEEEFYCGSRKEGIYDQRKVIREERKRDILRKARARARTRERERGKRRQTIDA